MSLTAVSIELFVDEAAPYRPLMTRLGLAERRVSPEVSIFEGGATVILHEGDADLPSVHPFAASLRSEAARGVGAEICLEVDDIEPLFNDLCGLSGFTVAEPLVQRPWGLRDFRVITPDGYYLRIMDPRRGSAA
jgi:hypothetical protein